MEHCYGDRLPRSDGEGDGAVGSESRATVGHRGRPVIKPDAAAIKRRRLAAKPWPAHEESATEPERVSHTPSGGGVALAALVAVTRFSSPVSARQRTAMHRPGGHRGVLARRN